MEQFQSGELVASQTPEQSQTGPTVLPMVQARSREETHDRERPRARGPEDSDSFSDGEEDGDMPSGANIPQEAFERAVETLRRVLGFETPEAPRFKASLG